MEFEDEIEVPVSALVRIEAENRYGHVPGLDDGELADPDELEQQVYAEAFGPVLALPVQRKFSGIRPNIGECGHVDWGAFGTMDFARLAPTIDRALYKADKLKEQLEHVLILMGIIRERIPGRAKYLVLKYLRLGVIGMEHIADPDMYALARRYREALRLQKEIARLRRYSREQREALGGSLWSALD